MDLKNVFLVVDPDLDHYQTVVNTVMKVLVP